MFCISLTHRHSHCHRDFLPHLLIIFVIRVGTQIKVFATRRPEGTYLTNVSFSIDDGPPGFWTSTDFVPAISYQNLVYTSPTLSPTQHRITITNLGQIFWFDFVQFTSADSAPSDDSGTMGSGNTGASEGTTTTQQQRITTSNSPPQSSSSKAPSSSTTKISNTGFAIQSSLSVSPTHTTSSTSSSTILALPESSGPSITSEIISHSSALTTTQSFGNQATQTGAAAGASGSGNSSSSSSQTPAIIAIAVAAGVVVCAFLLFAFWWFRVRRKPEAPTHLDDPLHEKPLCELSRSSGFVAHAYVHAQPVRVALSPASP